MFNIPRDISNIKKLIGELKNQYLLSMKKMNSIREYLSSSEYVLYNMCKKNCHSW